MNRAHPGPAASRSPQSTHQRLPIGPAPTLLPTSAKAGGPTRAYAPYGTVYHANSTTDRGVEFLMGYYGILDRAPKGRDEGDGFQLWIRLHDDSAKCSARCRAVILSVPTPSGRAQASRLWSTVRGDRSPARQSSAGRLPGRGDGDGRDGSVLRLHAAPALQRLLQVAHVLLLFGVWKFKTGRAGRRAGTSRAGSARTSNAVRVPSGTGSRRAGEEQLDRSAVVHRPRSRPVEGHRLELDDVAGLPLRPVPRAKAPPGHR